MVPDLWPLFYRHAQRKNYWARLAINCWQSTIATHAASAYISALAGNRRKVAYLQILKPQASVYRAAKRCYSISGHVLRNRIA